MTRAEQIDFSNKQLRLARKSETAFTEANDAMREYYKVSSHKLPPLPQELVLSDFYTSSNAQHDRELVFITFEYDCNWQRVVLVRVMEHMMLHDCFFASVTMYI